VEASRRSARRPELKDAPVLPERAGPGTHARRKRQRAAAGPGDRRELAGAPWARGRTGGNGKMHHGGRVDEEGAGRLAASFSPRRTELSRGCADEAQSKAGGIYPGSGVEGKQLRRSKGQPEAQGEVLSDLLRRQESHLIVSPSCSPRAGEEGCRSCSFWATTSQRHSSSSEHRRRRRHGPISKAPFAQARAGSQKNAWEDLFHKMACRSFDNDLKRDYRVSSTGVPSRPENRRLQTMRSGFPQSAKMVGSACSPRNAEAGGRVPHLLLLLRRGRGPLVKTAG